MGHTLIRRCGCGGGGGGVPYRRDAPEIIVPTLAAASAKSLGNNDVLPAYTQIIAALPIDTVIVAALMGYRTGATTPAGGGGTTIAQRLARARFGSGAAGAEVRFGEVRLTGSTDITVTNPGPTTTVVAVETPGVLLPLGPRKFVAGTRLAYTGAWNDAVGIVQAKCYLIGLDPTKVSTKFLPWSMDTLLQGGVATDTVVSDYAAVSRAAAIWTFGAWTTLPIKGAGVADRDYLVIDFHYGGWAGTIIDNQFEVGIGAAGSEVVQSRFGDPGSIGFPYGARRNTPWVPFVLYSGERLAARVAGAAAVADTVTVSAVMMAL